jgi:hypothetical protein
MKIGISGASGRMAYYQESFIDEVRMSLPRGVHAATSNTPVNFVSRDDVAAAAAGILAGEGHHSGDPSGLPGTRRRIGLALGRIVVGGARGRQSQWIRAFVRPPAPRIGMRWRCARDWL